MPATKHKTDPLVELVEDCYDKYGANIHNAALEMAKSIRQSDVLYRQLMEPLLQQACLDKLRGRMRDDRSAIWVMPVASIEALSRVHQLAAGNLMMFRLPTAGNKLLRDSLKDDVADASRFYHTAAQNMKFKSDWLDLITLELPNGITVGDHFTEAQLRELQTTAKPSQR